MISSRITSAADHRIIPYFVGIVLLLRFSARRAASASLCHLAISARSAINSRSLFLTTGDAGVLAVRI
jgi:hypothetical protein